MKFKRAIFTILFFSLGLVACDGAGGTKNPFLPTGTLFDEKDVEDGPWKIDFHSYGVTFRDDLAEQIEDMATRTASYSSCLSIGKAAAAFEDSFIPFYRNTPYKESDGNVNREHIWPNARGGGSKNGGSNIEKDPFAIRPTVESDNGGRGMNFYGKPGVYANVTDPGFKGYDGARGEAARIIFYIATRYGKSNGLSLSNTPSDDQSRKTMGVLRELYIWNKQYPVSPIEKQINNYLCEQGYGRNPFVDYPELVNFIWDMDGFVTKDAPVYDFVYA